VSSPSPDIKLRRRYEVECDCGWIDDGVGRAALLRHLHAHRARCGARIRLHRVVTAVWVEKKARR
jgi:hypothetical protein